MGSFAAAGGSVLGTGAFSTAEATRDVSVQVANENNAFLSIKPSNTANGQFATQGSTDNQIGLDFSGSGNGGSGVGQNSVYNFDDVFRIANQGTQTIYVWSRLSGGSKFDDDNLYFYPNGSRSTELNDSSNSVLTLSPGESAKIGVHVDTGELSTGSDSITATIRADVDKPGNSGSVGPGGDEALVVSQTPDQGDFSSIQNAIDSVDGTTILVEDGPDTYDEQVTVDTSLTLRGIDDPTVVAPGTANTFEVTADDVTIEGFEIRNPGTNVSASPTDFSGVIGVNVQSGTTGVTVRDNLIAGLGTGNDDANPIAVNAQGETSGITVESNRIENLEGTDEDEGAVQAVLINSQKALNGIDDGIDNARVANNTITNLLDTRSTNAIRFNGDVSGEIVGNTISNLNTEGDIPGTDDPGGFTQVIALQQGGNSTTGPSDVTIKNNGISNIETTTADNWAPPFHIIVGPNASNVNITGNDLTADSQDTEVFVEDRSSGSPSLNKVLNDKNNVFNPEAVAGENRIIPLQTESGGLFANLGTDGIAPLQAGTKLSEFPTGPGSPYGLDGEFMQPVYANKTDESISIDVVSNGFGPTELDLGVGAYNGVAFAGENQWTRIPTGEGTPYPLVPPETAWDSNGDFQGGPISGGPDGDYELVEISETDGGFKIVWEFLGTQDGGLNSQTVEGDAKQPPEEDAAAY